MTFTHNEKAFLVWEYTGTQSNKSVQRVFLEEIQEKYTIWKEDMDMVQKIQRGVPNICEALWSWLLSIYIRLNRLLEFLLGGKKRWLLL